MKLLHVISSMNPVAGGPVEGIRQLGGTLRRQGHHVEVASLDGPDAKFLQESPVPVYPLGPSSLKYSFGPRLIPWLRANRNRYDAIIVNGIWQFHSFAAWLALRKSNTPYVVFTHGMLDPWFKRQYPLKHLKKWMYWPWAEYRVLRDAKAVVFTCDEERVLARQSFWLYKAAERVVAYGTADPQLSESQRKKFLEAYPSLREKRFLLFLSRIHRKKGCDLLLQAFSSVYRDHHDHRLVIAGPDTTRWRPDLERLASDLGIAERV